MTSEDLVYNYLVLVLVALVLGSMLLFNEYFIRYCLGGTWMNSRQIWMSIGTTFILLSLMISRFYYLKNYEKTKDEDKAQYMMLSRTSFYVLLVLSLLFVLSLVLYAGKFSWAIKNNNVEKGRVLNWFRGVKQIPSQCRVIRESREREKMRKETRLRSTTRLSTRSSLPLSIRGSTPEQRPTERTERTGRRPTERTERTGRKPTRMTSIDEIDVHVDDTLTFDNE